MTQDQIKEAIAKAIYCHEGNLPAPWDNAGDEWESSWAVIRDEAMSQAAAVMALVGPKPLHWMRNGNHWAGGLGYVVRKTPPKGRYVLTFRNQFDQYFDTMEEAQAAAEAHHIAAYWAQSKLTDAAVVADARIAELEAALTRAWEMGRDAAAAAAFNAIAKYPLRTMLTNADNATMLELTILALTPPADLAERISAARSKSGGE